MTTRQNEVSDMSQPEEEPTTTKKTSRSLVVLVLILGGWFSCALLSSLLPQWHGVYEWSTVGLIVIVPLIFYLINKRRKASDPDSID